MTRWMGALGAVMLAASFSGCGGSEAADSADAKQDNEKAVVESVSKFLDAVKTGDDKGAEAMLTPLARKKTNEAELAVTPPGRDSAEYSIGKVEHVADDEFHVEITWRDVDEEGEVQEDLMTWMLKDTEEGWRISGMAAKPFEDRPRVYLNFEDPEDMQRALHEVRQEATRRATDTLRQASRPERPSQTGNQQNGPGTNSGQAAQPGNNVQPPGNVQPGSGQVPAATGQPTTLEAQPGTVPTATATQNPSTGAPAGTGTSSPQSNPQLQPAPPR